MNIDWVPVFVAALSIFGAAVTYAYQRRVDRRVALIETTRVAYRNHPNAFLAMSDSPERVKEIQRQHNQSELELLVAEVRRTMREDCFEKTDLSVTEIQALVPIA